MTEGIHTLVVNDVDAPFVADGGERVNDVVLVEIFVACEEVSKGIRDGSGCEERGWARTRHLRTASAAATAGPS